MSTGQEEPTPAASGRGHSPDVEEGDRFQQGINIAGEIISLLRHKSLKALFYFCSSG